VRYLRDLSEYSPLEIWAGRAYKALQNDAILPNPYTRNVARLELSNGAEMLFLKSEVEHHFAPQPVHIDSLIRLKKALEDRNIGLLVILVPDKFTVYHTLLQNPTPYLEAPAPYIDELERALRAASVRSVNLKTALRRAAAAGIPSNHYVYHLDDTHWNDAGVAVAESEVRAFLAAEKDGP
jgi:hypothetical protein